MFCLKHAFANSVRKPETHDLIHHRFNFTDRDPLPSSRIELRIERLPSLDSLVEVAGRVVIVVDDSESGDVHSTVTEVGHVVVADTLNTRTI